MYALYLKELRSFLNSLIGYLTILIFIVSIGIWMWIFPGGGNVLDMGEASLRVLFSNAPIVFLFLIPAITMRSLAEENRTGTIELLLTKPISDLSIILAKYFASVTLVFLALLPTLIYYYSVVELGEPRGNIDHAGTLGAYFGLFLLGAVFVSIGIFASSLTQNQVVSFLIAMLLCFIFYIGFQFMAVTLEAPFDLFFINLSIQEHYLGMQRGVIDSRDLIYYLSVIALFIVLTRTVMQSRKW